MEYILYKTAFSNFRDNIRFYAVIAVVITINDRFFDTSIGGTIFLMTFIAYYTHFTILTGGYYGFGYKMSAKDEKRKFPSWEFIWRYISQLVFSFLAILLPVMLVAKIASPNPNIVKIVAFVSLPLAYFVVLTFVGTILPAATIKGDASFATALARSRGKRLRIFGRFLAGPVFTFVVGMGILGVVLVLFPTWKPVIEHNMVLSVAFGIAWTPVGFIPVILGTVVLCDVFGEFENRVDLSAQ
jgi:hypothetical protein